MKLNILWEAAAETNATPAAAVLVGDNVNTILGIDAQVVQNLPTTGNPADSGPFLESFAIAPVTGCTSLMDQARLKAGFDPLIPGSLGNPQALAGYVEALVSNTPLFVKELFDSVNIHRENSDWNQVINEIVNLYPVGSSAQREEVRANLVRLITTAASYGSVVATSQLMSQHTLQTNGADIGVYIYISTIRFEKKEDGKETTEQVDFTIHRAIVKFQTHLWDQETARQTAEKHFKSISNWLDGMNTKKENSAFSLACFQA